MPSVSRATCWISTSYRAILSCRHCIETRGARDSVPHPTWARPSALKTGYEYPARRMRGSPYAPREFAALASEAATVTLVGMPDSAPR